MIYISLSLLIVIDLWVINTTVVIGKQAKIPKTKDRMPGKNLANLLESSHPNTHSQMNGRELQPRLSGIRIHAGHAAC